MQDDLLSVLDDGTILVTVAFLENGDVLLSGDSGLQVFELDLVVREDITCDQFLGAIYAGLRDVLMSRYHLHMLDRVADLAYRQEGKDRAALRKDREEVAKLRPNIKRGIRLRTYAFQQNIQSRKLAKMEEKFSFGAGQKILDPQVREKIGWIVCWQVFHECYRTYISGYPSDERHAIYGKSKFGVIARSSAGGCDEKGVYTDAWMEKPLIWLNRAVHGDRKLCELGFHSGTRMVFDPVLMRGSPAIVEKMVWIPQKYKTEPDSDDTGWSTRPYQSEFVLDIPEETAIAEGRDLISTVLSPLVTTGAVLSAWLISGASLQIESVLVTAGAMVAATVAVSLINGCTRKKSRNRANWRCYGDYEQYIRHVIDTVRQHQKYLSEQVSHRHPPVWTDACSDCLVNRIANDGGNVFSFRQLDSDFLWVRLGTTVRGSQLVGSGVQLRGGTSVGAFSTVKYVNLQNTREKPFRIVMGKVKEGENWGYLRDLPNDLIREYAYVENAPVGVSLVDHAAIGLLLDDPDKDFQPILDNLLLDLCCNHRPEDLQVVCFFRETVDVQAQHQKIQHYKHLPHMRHLFSDRSQFVFTNADALQVLDRLCQICEARGKSENPHILVIFEQGYELKNHPLADVLTKDKGITCLFCCHRIEEVPGGCTSVIECEHDGRWLLLPGVGKGYTQIKAGPEYQFEPDPMVCTSNAPVCQATFSRLAFLYHRVYRKRPSKINLSFFQLLMDYCISCGTDVPKLYAKLQNREKQLEILRDELRDYIRLARQRHCSGKAKFMSLSVPIGNNREGVVCVDLHEKGDGPHLLVFDEHNIGKHMVLSTYLLSLCTHYEPDLLKVIALTCSGRETLGYLEQLPHVKLLCTDDGQTGEGSYHLEALLQTLCTEIEERKQLLEAWRVSTVDEYNRAVKRAQSGIGKNLFARKVPEQSSDELKLLTHQLIVLDDYQMLQILAEQGNPDRPFDLDGTIAELIRLSNGLGIHFVISTNQSEQEFSDALSGCISSRLQLTEHSGDGDRGVLGLLSGSNCMKKQVLIANADEDIVCRSCDRFSVTMASIQGQYSTFFDTEDFDPSYYEFDDVWDNEKDKQDQEIHNPNADPRPEEPAEEKPKVEAFWVKPKYKPADHVFYRPQSLGVKQQEFLAEVLSQEEQ